MFNFFVSFAFFMYFIFGSLTLCITCTANEDLRREREGEPDDDDQLTTVSSGIQDSTVNKKAKKINNNKQVYQKVPTEVPVISKEVSKEEATITKDPNKEYTGKVTHL